MKKITLLLTAVLFAANASAESHLFPRLHLKKVEHKVDIKPTTTPNDFTLNGTDHYVAKLECTFINTSSHEETVTILNQPDVSQPYASIVIKPGTSKKPSLKKADFHFRLFKQWWCHIYDNNPSKNRKMNFCAYVAVVNPHYAHFYPFSYYKREKINRSLSYSCHISSDEGQLQAWRRSKE